MILRLFNSTLNLVLPKFRKLDVLNPSETLMSLNLTYLLLRSQAPVDQCFHLLKSGDYHWTVLIGIFQVGQHSQISCFLKQSCQSE